MVVSVAEALEAGNIQVSSIRPMVLIVDDEQIIADTLSTIFRMDGYNVLTAYDGSKGFELAEVARPDLMIADVMMPNMSGVDLAILVRHAVPDCKILLFSGQAATVDLLAEARQLGYDFNTLNKPVHPTDMLARAAAWLRAA